MLEFPTKLKEFLESSDFVKAGVAIQNDVKKLYRDCEVSTRNCVDLSLLARCADNAQWKGKYNTPLGLARLIETYENLTLSKGKIGRSNWEDELTSNMAEYASNDAHAGYVLYQRLIYMANAMEKVPKPVYYTFDAVRGRLCEPTGMHWNSYNPDYDPGPPPPPKAPKEPTARELRRAAARAFPTTAHPESVTVSNHLIIEPSTTRRRYFAHPNPASQQRFTPNNGPMESSSSSSNPQSHLRRHMRPHFFPSPIHRESIVSNPSSQPGFGMLPPHSDLFRTEIREPPTEVRPLSHRGLAQMGSGSGDAS